MRRPHTDLPQHIADAIRQAWPEGVIDTPVDSDDAPFWKLSRRVKAALSHLPGAAVFYEREPRGGPRWGETSNPDEDPPDWHDESRSYGLFFVSSTDERLKFATDTTDPDEEDVEQHVRGEGRIGVAVAISLVAPFAVVTLHQMEVFENGSQSEPDVEPHLFSLDGRKLDPEDHYRELVDEAGFTVVRNLRAEIIRVLGECGVAVIPEEDRDRPVRGLRASEDVVVGRRGEPITVQAETEARASLPGIRTEIHGTIAMVTVDLDTFGPETRPRLLADADLQGGRADIARSGWRGDLGGRRRAMRGHETWATSGSTTID